MSLEKNKSITLVRNMVTATVVIVIIHFMMLFGSFNTAKAQTPWCHHETNQVMEQQKVNITNAVLQNLKIRTDREGNPVYVGWCRSQQNAYTCEENIEKIVSYIVFESVVEQVDPWIVASIAWKETRFSAFAVGAIGERGVMQLHPRNSRFNQVRFLHSGNWYRNRCRNKQGLCQQEVIHKGVSLYAASLEMCGSVRGALTMYNTGRCHWRGHRYAPRVTRIHRMLLDSI